MAKNKWIIVSKFLPEVYYNRINDDNYEELYDPRAATVFTSKKVAQEWIAKNSTMEEFMSVEELEPHVERFEDFLSGGMVRRSFPLASQSALNIPYDPKKHTWQDVVKWWFSICGRREYTVQHHNYTSWPDLWQVCKSLHEVNGYWSTDHTNLFRTFSFAIRKDQKYSDFANEVAHVLVAFRDDLMRNEDGDIIFDIFDHHLCEGGNSVNLVKSDTASCWQVHYRGRSNRVSAEGTLEDVFEWLRKHRYYN